MNGSEVDFYCYSAYLGPFWLIGLMSDKRRNKKLRFHLGQGITLFIFEIAAVVCAWFLGKALLLIPVAGSALRFVVWGLLFALAFWLSVKGMLNVAADTKTALPIIGRIRLFK